MSAVPGSDAATRPRALVTGAAEGLGQALAAGLASRGFVVDAIDVQARPGGETAAERTADDVSRTGVAVGDPPASSAAAGRWHVADLGDRAAVEALIPALVAGGPYGLVAFNAGVNATGRFEEISDAEHLRLLAVNAETPIRIATALVASGTLAPGGRLVFVSSLSHFTGYPGAASYAASKDALAVWARSIRPAAARRGLTVTVAFPGPLDTAHATRHAPAGTDASRRMKPQTAASAILDAAFAGRKTVVPGFANQLIALTGNIFPGFLARRMRRLLFDRLVG